MVSNDSKLTPQNAEQEHMVQILLAIMQKIPVEVNIGGEWITSTILFPGYRSETMVNEQVIERLKQKMVCPRKVYK